MTARRIEEIEHTADWAIRVRTASLPDLFTAAAEGMFGLLADLSIVSRDQKHDIDLRAVDAEALLIDWLNELLYLAEQRGLVFARFDIHRLDTTDGAQLAATAFGGRPRELNKVIKAATFHGLAIRRDAAGFQVDLVFDV